MSPPPFVKQIPTRHGPMLTLPGDQFITRTLEACGEISPGELHMLLQLIRPGATVVEVGSNIGVHTVPMARACRPGRLYAFEPQRRVFQILCANLVLNGIDNVVALPEGCADAAGEATIPPIDYAGAGNFGGVSLHAAGQAGEAVRLVRLDDLALPELALLKVDCEGLELQVLAGAVATIRRLRPYIYIENDRREKQRALIGALDQLGYDLYWHTPPLSPRDNFNGVTEPPFPRLLSINMLCTPRERKITVASAERIDPADPRASGIVDPERRPLV